MSELEAVIWAKELHGATILAYLKKGDRFHFPNSTEIMVNTGRGWYLQTSMGRKFRTSMKSPVIKIED